MNTRSGGKRSSAGCAAASAYAVTTATFTGRSLPRTRYAAGELDALEQVLTESTRTGRAAARPYLDCLRPGTEYTIKRGTPIAQAIPIRREAWQLRAVAWDAAAREQIEKDMAANRDDFYKARHWQKKSYD